MAPTPPALGDPGEAVTPSILLRACCHTVSPLDNPGPALRLPGVRHARPARRLLPRDYCPGFVRSFVYGHGAVTSTRDWTADMQPDGRRLNQVASFGQDARGEFYISIPTERSTRSYRSCTDDVSPGGQQNYAHVSPRAHQGPFHGMVHASAGRAPPPHPIDSNRRPVLDRRHGSVGAGTDRGLPQTPCAVPIARSSSSDSTIPAFPTSPFTSSTSWAERSSGASPCAPPNALQR
jgi:hypothetical protein